MNLVPVLFTANASKFLNPYVTILLVLAQHVVVQLLLHAPFLHLLP